MIQSGFIFFFFILPAPSETHTLSLHDALPIFSTWNVPVPESRNIVRITAGWSVSCARRMDTRAQLTLQPAVMRDRKSTRLNSSHSQISYAVFCLKKKKNG